MGNPSSSQGQEYMIDKRKDPGSSSTMYGVTHPQDDVTFHAATQCKKCFYISKAFYGQTWSTLLKWRTEKKSSKWEIADGKYEAILEIQPTIFDQMLFDTHVGAHMQNKTFMSLESWFWFLRISEFQARFKYKPEIVFASRIPPSAEAKPELRETRAQTRDDSEGHRLVIGM